MNDDESAEFVDPSVTEEVAEGRNEAYVFKIVGKCLPPDPAFFLGKGVGRNPCLLTT